ncbi:unnamed protein product, partial [Rotaria sordida]
TFQYDSKYEENDEQYNVIRERILNENQSSSFVTDDEGDRKKDNFNEEEKEKQQETNLAALRQKKIYSPIQTNITFEECAYKLLRMNLRHEQDIGCACGYQDIQIFQNEFHFENLQKHIQME